MERKEKIISASIILVLVMAITLLFGPNVYAMDFTVSIQDQVLKTKLVNNYDTNKDGEMQESEMLGIQYLSTGYDDSISSLSGLQYAKNLKELSIAQTETNLDFRYLNNITTLTKIYLAGEFNDISTISNLTTLKSLSLSSYSYGETGIDLSDLSRLTNLEVLYINGNMFNSSQIANLTNLKQLDLYYISINEDIDIKNFKDLDSLHTMKLNGSVVNTSYLKDMDSLTSLSINIFFSDYNINFEDISCLNKLTELELINYDGNLINIEKMTALRDLEIVSSSRNNYSLDMLNLKKATQIETLRLEGDLELINGIDEMTGLKSLYLTNRIGYSNFTNQDLVLSNIENLDLEFLNIQGTFRIKMGYICIGNQRTINIEELSEIYKATKDSTSILYEPNIEYSILATATGAQANMDNQNDSLVITSASNFGEYHTAINPDKPYESQGFTGELQFVWINAVEDDRTNEITIPDLNFKNALLEDYDLDNNGKITMFDMVNIESLILMEKGIVDITGIENVINASYIDLSLNCITDISPLNNMNNICGNYMGIRLYDNYIEDISNYNGKNIYCLKLGYNYIDVSEGSENLRTIKDCIAAVISEDYDNNPNYYTETKEESIDKAQSAAIDYFRNSKKVGTIEYRNNVPVISEEVRARLVSEGVDRNNNGIITVGEMTDFGGINIYETGQFASLDLSGLNISDLSFIRNFSHVESLDLSNNNISDFSDLERCNSLYEIDLSNNNITSIEGIERLEEVNSFDFSNNDIVDISPITNIANSSYYYLDGMTEKYQKYLTMDFSNNKINDVSAIKEVECLSEIILSNNYITNISCLEDMEFEIIYDDVFLKKVDLSNNYIVMDEEYIRNVGYLFYQNYVSLNLDNQQELNYDKDCLYDAETNTVTAIITYDLGFKNTKPSWTLSEDKKTYTKEYTENGTYTTTFATEDGFILTETFVITEIDDVAPEIAITTEYSEAENIVTVTATSNELLGETKSTWSLSEDKKSYSKDYTKNGIYTTTFEDIYGNSRSKSFEVKGIETGFEVTKQYNAETNKVVVTATCNIGFEATKPSWTLSENNTVYTKEYSSNGTYSTSFILSDLGVETPSFEITEIDDVAPIITITKQYNEQDNTVTVIATSSEILGETKPSWTLSTDKMSYSKIYTKNGTYSTTFADVYGNIGSKSFEVNEIETGFEVTKQYNTETNKVVVTATCNIGFEATKPSWTLSENNTVYTKEYSSNGVYSTPFILSDSSVETSSFEITEIDDVAPIITITKQYNEQDNTVTVTAASSEILGETKPSWTLSTDKMSYTKIYTKNGTYTTTFEDVYGNIGSKSFEVNEIETGFEVTKQYNTETNKVVVTATCNIGFEATKPSWKLSEDKTVYTKEYSSNGTYSTPFILSDSSVETPSFEITEIDDVEPIISISQEYNETTGIIKVTATSSKMLKDTKPSWTLSTDKMSYSKEYSHPGTTVTTPFQDTKGNITNVTFVVGAEIQIDYSDITGKTTVSVESPIGFNETKPSWQLSSDKTIYSKEYSSNGKYGTPFTFLDGTVARIEFEINN